MTYLKEYFKVVCQVTNIVSCLYYVAELWSGEPIAGWLMWMAMVVGLAGPLALLISRNKNVK